MKQLRILAILLAAILIISCNKNEEQVTGQGDVLIVTKKLDKDTIYGISLYAYTSSSFTSVTAVNSADPTKTYTLDGGYGSYFYETPEEQYSITKPAAGDYTFSAAFENGTQQVFHNTLFNEVLPIPTYENCTYNALTHQLEIKWKLNRRAASYIIQLFDGSRLVFASDGIKNTAAVAIQSTRGGWDQDYVPVNGKTYQVRLLAYMFEPNGGAYNLQCIAQADTTAMWGN